MLHGQLLQHVADDLVAIKFNFRPNILMSLSTVLRVVTLILQCFLFDKTIK
jgi:hypothetical protein